MRKQYIYIRQGEIGRWQHSDKRNSEVGFYTEGFYNCLVLILRSAQKITMIHADLTISLSDLAQEIAWHDGDCEKILYYKDNRSALETIHDIFGSDSLRGQFDKRVIPEMHDEDGRVVIDKNLPPLPSGERVSEFVTDMILLDEEAISPLKVFNPLFELIDSPDKINEAYRRFQETDFKSGIKKGSRSDEIKQAIQETASTPSELFRLIWLAIESEALDRIDDYLSYTNINQQFRLGYTMLTLAAAEGKLNVVNHLLERGANSNIAMDMGSTPLFLAAGRGHRFVVEALLESNADPSMQTDSGTKAEDIAETRGHHAISTLIKTWRERSTQNVAFTAEDIRTILSRITPGKRWGVNLKRAFVWLTLSDQSEAEEIVTHFKTHGYIDIRLMRDAKTNNPVVALSKTDMALLQAMPAFIPVEEAISMLTLTN